MTEVNVSATVGRSVTVGECPKQWGKCSRQWGNVHKSGGNVYNSGEIEYGLGNVIVEIVIHNPI